MAYAGAGHLGVLVTDMSIIMTLLGVCIAFQITFATLLHEVPGKYRLAFLCIFPATNSDLHSCSLL